MEQLLLQTLKRSQSYFLAAFIVSAGLIGSGLGTQAAAQDEDDVPRFNEAQCPKLGGLFIQNNRRQPLTIGHGHTDQGKFYYEFDGRRYIIDGQVHHNAKDGFYQGNCYSGILEIEPALAKDGVTIRLSESDIPGHATMSTAEIQDDADRILVNLEAVKRLPRHSAAECPKEIDGDQDGYIARGHPTLSGRKFSIEIAGLESRRGVWFKISDKLNWYFNGALNTDQYDYWYETSCHKGVLYANHYADGKLQESNSYFVNAAGNIIVTAYRLKASPQIESYSYNNVKAEADDEE